MTDTALKWLGPEVGERGATCIGEEPGDLGRLGGLSRLGHHFRHVLPSGSPRPLPTHCSRKKIHHPLQPAAPRRGLLGLDAEPPASAEAQRTFMAAIYWTRDGQ